MTLVLMKNIADRFFYFSFLGLAYDNHYSNVKKMYNNEKNIKKSTIF